jgi:hypothetical protein
MPQLAVTATVDERLRCMVRNFILDQASDHGTYDHRNHRVTLPCIFYANSGNPDCKFHLHCLTSYETTEHELKQIERQDEVIRAVNKYQTLT